MGIVIKISEGKLVVAAIKSTKCYDKVGYAEAEAAHLGLEVAKNTGSLPLIIETYSQEVPDLI